MKLKNVNNMQTLAALIFDCLQSTEIIARAAGDSDQYGGQFPSNKTGSLIFFYQTQRNRRQTIVSSIFYWDVLLTNLQNDVENQKHGEGTLLN